MIHIIIDTELIFGALFFYDILCPELYIKNPDFQAGAQHQ